MKALEYLDRGWRVFPCHSIIGGRCSCSKGSSCDAPGKHPRTVQGVKDASDDPNIVRSWFTQWPTANVAVATGLVSGVFAVDVDPRHDGFESLEEFEGSRESGPLPPTLTAITGGGGRHLFFVYPGEQVPGRINWLPGVDVKSDGGYVVLAPSNHISGGVYAWQNDLDVAQPPSDLLQSIRDKGGMGSTGESLPSTSDILKGVPEGARDDTLFRACCRWRRQLNDRTAVEVLALQAAANCTPSFPADEARKCVDSAFRQDHTDASMPTWQVAVDQAEIENLTDRGNARRLVKAFGSDIRYVPGWGWLIWTDGGWVRDTDEQIMRLAQEVPELIRTEAERVDDLKAQALVHRWANQTEMNARLDATVKVARSMSEVIRTNESFDSDDYELACRNGIVDLRTGEMRPLTRNDNVSKNTGVVYDPTYELPEWEKFLREALDENDDIIGYIQRAAGYTLTGSNAEEVFFIISGPPNSGKGTFADGLDAALGDYATNTQPETFMWRRNQSTAREELARLAGLRLVTMSELKEGESFNESLVKQVTGGDKITAKFLYENPFSFRPRFKLWMNTNHEPDARDEALWRRIKKVTFPIPVPYARRDPRLKAMIKDPEVGGRAVLAWAVRGAVEWHKNGLQQPMEITQQIARYRDEQDRFGQFMNECITFNSTESVEAVVLYQTYSAWCRTVNERALRITQFQQLLRTRGYDYGKDDGGRLTYTGIGVQPIRLNGAGLSWGT